MGNRKNLIFGVVLISTITLTTSCGITITRNQYYGTRGQIEKPSAKKEDNNSNQTYTLKNMKNGQNR